MTGAVQARALQPPFCRAGACTPPNTLTDDLYTHAHLWLGYSPGPAGVGTA